MDVLYSITRGRGRERRVWWPATVERVMVVEDKSGITFSGDLRFDGMFGFMSSVEEFDILADSQVMDKKGV